MKILYLSCHEILEFDELSLLQEIGVEVFSVGAYLIPNQRDGKHLRPPIRNSRVNEEDLAQFRSLVQPGEDYQKCLTKDFIDRFDAVIVMHKPEWVEACFHANSSTPIIWRTIGQSTPSIELRMTPFRDRGLRIIRYSPLEQRLQHYCGHDAVIRFGKSLDGFEKWTGNVRRVVTFSNHMRQRGPYCSYDTFRTIIEPFECDLYGAGNHDIIDISRGVISFADQFRVLSRYRVFVYTGTYPASYTLAFIEAWLAGIPIVAIGRRLWEIGEGRGSLYEVPDLITHNLDGFVSDDISVLQSSIRRLLKSANLARDISERGRETAKRLFGTSSIAMQWRDFLKGIEKRKCRVPVLHNLLAPRALPGGSKNPQLIRVGRPMDGGYLVPCDPNSSTVPRIHSSLRVPLISFGIGGDISFEIDWIRCTGMPSICYDTATPPELWSELINPCNDSERAMLKFLPKLAELDGGRPTVEALNLLPPTGNWALKMDIEGSEYPILEEHEPLLSAESSGCLLIVMELHWLSAPNWRERAILLLQKLHKNWLLAHSHTNNFMNTWTDELGIQLPEVVELTWLRRSLLPPDWPDQLCRHPRPLVGLDYPNNGISN